MISFWRKYNIICQMHHFAIKTTTFAIWGDCVYRKMTIIDNKSANILFININSLTWILIFNYDKKKYVRHKLLHSLMYFTFCFALDSWLYLQSAITIYNTRVIKNTCELQKSKGKWQEVTTSRSNRTPKMSSVISGVAQDTPYISRYSPGYSWNGHPWIPLFRSWLKL